MISTPQHAEAAPAHLRPHVDRVRDAGAEIALLAENDDQALVTDFRAAVEALARLTRRATARHATLADLAHRVESADAELKRLGQPNGTRDRGITAQASGTPAVRLYAPDGAQTVTAPPTSQIIAAAVELAAQNGPLVEHLLKDRGCARAVLAAVPVLGDDWRITDAERAQLTHDQVQLAASHGRLA